MNISLRKKLTNVFEKKNPRKLYLNASQKRTKCIITFKYNSHYLF